MTSELKRILLVEDDPRDVELILTALGDYNLANEVIVAGDGEEALDYLVLPGKFRAASEGQPGRSAPGPEDAESERHGRAETDQV